MSHDSGYADAEFVGFGTTLPDGRDVEYSVADDKVKKVLEALEAAGFDNYSVVDEESAAYI